MRVIVSDAYENRLECRIPLDVSSCERVQMRECSRGEKRRGLDEPSVCSYRRCLRAAICARAARKVDCRF